MPAYQHLPVLPRKTPKHKLPFQEQSKVNTTPDNHLPDLSLYGISENNLQNDPILVPPQLQTAHTLHQLPKCIQECNQSFLTQPSQTNNLHKFLQEKLDKRQSKILDQLTEDESFHQQHTYSHSPHNVSQCHSTLASYNRDDPIQKDWCYIDKSKFLSSYILPTDNHTFQHITTHQQHPFYPNSSSAIYGTPSQQPQILSVTTSNTSRPTALP